MTINAMMEKHDDFHICLIRLETAHTHRELKVS